MKTLKTLDGKTYSFDNKEGWTDVETGELAPEEVLKLLTTVEPSRAPKSEVKPEEIKPKKQGRPKKTKEDYKRELDEAQVALDNAQLKLQEAKDSLGEIEDDGTTSVEVRDTKEIREAKDAVKEALNNFSAIEDRYRSKLTREEREAYREANRSTPIEIAPIGRIPSVKLEGNRLPLRDSIHNRQAGLFDDPPIYRSGVGKSHNFDDQDAIPEEQKETISSVEEMVNELSEIDAGLRTGLAQEQANATAHKLDNKERQIEETHARSVNTDSSKKKNDGAASLLVGIFIGGVLASIFDPVTKLIEKIEKKIEQLKEWWNDFTGFISDTWSKYVTPNVTKAADFARSLYIGKNSKTKTPDPVVESKPIAEGSTIDKISDFARGIFTGEDTSKKTVKKRQPRSKPKAHDHPSFGKPATKDAEPESDTKIKDDPYKEWRNPPGGGIKNLEGWIKSKGLRISIGKNAKRNYESAHNLGGYFAADINATAGDDLEANHPKWGPVFDVLADELRMKGYKVLWRVGGHLNHMHIQYGTDKGLGRVHEHQGTGGKHKAHSRHLRGKGRHNHESRSGVRDRYESDAVIDYERLKDDPSADKAGQLSISVLKAIFANMKGMIETDTEYKGTMQEIAARANKINNSATEAYARKIASNSKKPDIKPQLPNLNGNPGTIHTPSESDDSWVANQYIEYFT